MGRGWASRWIERLCAGESVSFRPRGNSMTGRVSDGQLVTVDPIETRDPKVGDVVLCEVHGAQYLHLVKAVQSGQGLRCLIGNNHGRINGWTSRVFGIMREATPSSGEGEA